MLDKKIQKSIQLPIWLFASFKFIGQIEIQTVQTTVLFNSQFAYYCIQKKKILVTKEE